MFTGDGWETFNKINTPVGLIGNFKAYYQFPETIVTWALGTKKISITQDLGKSWLVKTIPDSINSPYPDLIFYSDSIYYYLRYISIGDYNGNTLVYKTTNAGDSWIKIFDLDEPLGDISFVNDSTYYIYGNNAFLTTNSGKDWKRLNNAYFDNYERKLLNIIQFSDNNKIAFSTAGTVKYSGNKTLKPPEFLNPKAYFDLPLDFELQWTPIQGADSYHLQIVENEGFLLNEPEKSPHPNFDSTLFINDSMLVDINYNLKGTSHYKTYTCRVRAVNDSMMSPWLARYWVTMNSTGIEYDNIHKSLLNFSPKPAQDFLHINLNQEFSYTTNIKIFNIHGQIVFAGEIPAGIQNFKINIEKLPSGMYFINAVNGQISETQKFVVIK